ncbi:hypothetical protein MO867_20215 [Microbulbifer sp. OS29]|uniref:Uncharacterized protein n=1 Tax=Microbulbifer okhotskensis TaxID=2926617 RepID=A0A9X2ERU5_9GAMM|nr:hypothetical protein [Microbulbifer okhotskensis]MCO1336654.1 hypothetical protein [Microbulbifer okhotskensis]
MLYYPVGVIFRAQLNAVFGGNLNVISNRFIQFECFTKELLAVVIPVDIRMIDGGNSPIYMLF